MGIRRRRGAGPVRTCIGCRRRADARELVRVVADGGVPRLGRELPGRGAWLCDAPECAARAQRSRGFARALRTSLDDAAVARFVEEFGGSR